MADELATEGYTVIVPKSFKQTALSKGGTDGDGLWPEFTFETNGAEFGPWIAAASPFEHVAALVDGVVAFAKSKGAERLVSVGCCWGCWAATVASSRHADFVASVSFHPAIGLEEMVNQKPPVTLVASAQCPFFYLPAGNDKEEEYGAEGVFTKALVEKFGTESVKTMRFEDMVHGWTSRGDNSDPKVALAQKNALDEAKAYLKARLA
jgi:dienelactone hydrolase